MKAFAAAGLIAAAAAIEATPTPGFDTTTIDFSKYYAYGNTGFFAPYPEYVHKEEFTPVKVHPRKFRPYKTYNIDIFEHSDSDGHKTIHKKHGGHGGERKHHKKNHHGSSSDTDEDDHKKAKKHHKVILTGDGPDGDHCHEGDYCGKVDESSDYTDSDYSSHSESEHIIFEKPDGCAGGERCARVDFDWNYLQISGSMDIYQSFGHGFRPLLFDGDFDNLTPWGKHEIVVKSLGKGFNRQYPDIPSDNCEMTGATIAWLGTTYTDKNGDGSLRVFNDQVCMDDIIGRSIEIRGKYEWYNRDPILQTMACGNVVEVPCPRKPKHGFFKSSFDF